MDFQYHVPADCEQICTNTQGSYSCSCVSGYQLSSDGKSCVGESHGTIWIQQVVIELCLFCDVIQREEQSLLNAGKSSTKTLKEAPIPYLVSKRPLTLRHKY